MHRLLVRLPATVALAVTLAGYPALALAAPPLDGASEPQVAATASPSDMEDMEGMDHGSEPSEAPEPSSEHGDEHGDEETVTAARPRLAVLSSFAGINGAVLITAGALRRRDRARHPRGRRALGAVAADEPARESR